ncbi:Fructoselysine-6-P-deglycase FrlB with duplicated sugar isomerase (SIS) domain [Arboricoccus pini]|uniref:Glutamine--fructose-6-phosphate aminotransferase [isomerizing] n=1 Tax=Arboricoccus pini TaxID=1963835 RepID=A0A212RNI0_9PROT|nr:SIS domain-containing protein [Arboricoccus pini]SNB74045.1 Fructoselysine-6-P-deglycase FrlB with duplicated sugar isomerase (SIS) domain [Arboricoccus pini]
MSTTPKPDGLVRLEAEMARQFQDASRSFEANQANAQAAARHIQETKRLHLVGMGASHWLNRTVEPLYRTHGIDATAVLASELLRAPLPGPATELLVSQSGASGEIVRYLDRRESDTEAFGLTLNASSPLGQRTTSLIGEGGPEQAFAATRSLAITLALHAAILKHLGSDPADFLSVLTAPPETESKGVPEQLAAARILILSSRGHLQGVVETAGLTFMELARRPALAIEGGQLRHGPLEVLSTETAIVLARPAGADADTVATVAQIALKAGLTPIVIDCSGAPPIEGARTVALPRLRGLAAAAIVLATLQRIFIDTATLLVPDIGTPLRSTKVTDGE